jgi:UDP-N-acetylmuramate dehydrogenase
VKVLEKPSLAALNTFGIDAVANLLLTVETEEDLLALPTFDASRDLLLGGGSNVLLVTDIPGTLFLNRIMGKEVVDQSEGKVLVEVGAGENWHDLVRWTLEKQFHGLENLSLIPGNSGAAPMQNIGAYGVELSSVLDSVTAWDWLKQTWRVFDREDCQFGYRDSYFKSGEPDRYLITSVRLALDLEFNPQLGYADLAAELAKHGQNDPDARAVSDAVIRIRRRKLPDPSEVGNAGSFFKNPVVSAARAAALREPFPELRAWPTDTGEVKLSAAWMIDCCGLKGHRRGGAAVSEQHALVIVNLGGASGADVWGLAGKVLDTVEDRFGIRLEPEPRIVDLG